MPGERTDPLLVAVLGAESTGKSTLAIALAERLRARGVRAESVPEVLRQWCAREGRTPRPAEQLPIAVEQERLVDEAAARVGSGGVVIADTTALMTAIYSAMLFEDGALLGFARERSRRYDLTLLTGLDIAWIADGLQRDGPHVRAPVDDLVRRELDAAGVGYAVVYGQGERRTEGALALVERAHVSAMEATACTATEASPQRRSLAKRSAAPTTSPTASAEDHTGSAARYVCARCGDAACERRLFRDLRR